MLWFLLLITVIVICSWLSPGSSVNFSAWRALDSTMATLSQGGGDDDDQQDTAPRHPWPRPERSPRPAVERYKTPSTSVKRKRVTPFQAKRVAARQHWRCAMCDELLTEDFEVDHIVPLHRGGSFDNDIDSLQALHKRCHLLKNSFEQRRS